MPGKGAKLGQGVNLKNPQSETPEEYPNFAEITG